MLWVRIWVKSVTCLSTDGEGVSCQRIVVRHCRQFCRTWPSLALLWKQWLMSWKKRRSKRRSRSQPGWMPIIDLSKMKKKVFLYHTMIFPLLSNFSSFYYRRLIIGFVSSLKTMWKRIIAPSSSLLETEERIKYVIPLTLQFSRVLGCQFTLHFISCVCQG